ncbi:MAG TPA: ABC transporter substrate-binding protein [Thermodesulfovibrionales bacterium]|nr:ABC transporter substrate-binding protein [Thermodesulfovibrionales bacterium]
MKEGIFKNLSFFGVIFLICLSLSIVTSCSSQNRLEGYVYYRLNTNPTTLDPALIVDVTGGSIAAKLFNGLVRLDEDLSIQPDIAKDWSISSDGLTYTFRMKRGIYFSNKREVKSHDVKYSFKRILHPQSRSPNTWVLEKILGADEFMAGRADDVKGIRVIDDYTLEIALRKPFSPFLHLLTMTAAYVVPFEEVEKQGPDFSAHPVGTGPFILKEWLPNRELRLEKREDYFDGPAHIRGIVYRIIPEDLTTVTEFELGNLDIINIPSSEYGRFRKDPEKQNVISSLKGINTYYLGLNCSKPPFNNPDVRKAINYAIDREKILNTIYEGRGRLAEGPVPDIIRTWENKPGYEYNPQKARDVIEREGLGATAISFYVTADQEVVDIAEVIQSYMNAVGLKVTIKQLEWSAYKEALNRVEPNMFYLSWWADYPDPENFLFPLFHSSNFGAGGNRTWYRNVGVDSMIEKAQHTLDRKERDLLYQKAEELIITDAPWVFLWHKTDFTIRQPRVKNYRIYPIYSMDKGTEISLSR